MNANNEFEGTDEMIETTQTNDESTGKIQPDDSNGWDPYEVWRTRVLRPRLRNGGENTAAVELEPHGLTVLAVTARS